MRVVGLLSLSSALASVLLPFMFGLTGFFYGMVGGLIAAVLGCAAVATDAANRPLHIAGMTTGVAVVVLMIGLFPNYW